MTHWRAGPALALAAASLVVLAVTGCAGPGATHSTPSLVSPTPGPTPTIAGEVPTTSPSPSPSITAGPVTPPPARTLPLVDSCDPTSVPSAISSATPSIGKAGSFTLHVPVLMYHRVVPLTEAGNSNSGLVVPPKTFDAQLTALSTTGWHTITMATLANDLAAHVTPPAKTVVITLDDGWADGYTYALPILESHGFVATYYVIAGRIDDPEFLSSSQLRVLVAAGDEIGDHTFDHRKLTGLGAADLKREIDAGAARIAQVTGVWPESLAYPSGYENSQVVAAVGACQSLQIAVLDRALSLTTPASPPHAGATQAPPTAVNLQAYETWADRFVVPRVRVTPGTTPAILLGLLGQS